MALGHCICNPEPTEPCLPLSERLYTSVSWTNRLPLMAGAGNISICLSHGVPSTLASIPPAAAKPTLCIPQPHSSGFGRQFTGVLVGQAAQTRPLSLQTPKYRAPLVESTRGLCSRPTCLSYQGSWRSWKVLLPPPTRSMSDTPRPH